MLKTRCFSLFAVRCGPALNASVSTIHALNSLSCYSYHFVQIPRIRPMQQERVGKAGVWKACATLCHLLIAICLWKAGATLCHLLIAIRQLPFAGFRVPFARLGAPFGTFSPTRCHLLSSVVIWHF